MKADQALRIDRGLPLHEQPDTGHNRWHPDIPPRLTADPGEVVCLETRDAIDGQVTPATTAAELATVDSHRIHPLTGPVHVNGAQPGDLLDVEILDVIPEAWGFGVETPDYGLLRDEFPDYYLAHFDLRDGGATSAQLPGVRLPGAPFMGVMGVAPSHEILAHSLVREREFAIPGYNPSEPRSAVPGDAAIAREGLCTIPPRSHGGNFDIKQLTRGAVLELPVGVPGALFSAGDAHFAQGDGECVTGLEMGATFYCRFGLRKGLAHERNITEPRVRRADYFQNPEHALPRRFFATTGQSFTASGAVTHSSITVAARSALRQMIDHLGQEYGFDRQQAYMICSLAVDLKISQAVNRPNYTASAVLPQDIFVD